MSSWFANSIRWVTRKPNKALEWDFANISHPRRPMPLTHLDQDGKPVRVVLEERLGNELWVRPLDAGEPEPSAPILVTPRDIVVPFTPIHSTSLNTSPTVGDTASFMFSIPVIEVRRDDEQRKTFLRTRKVDEPMPTKRARAPWGYEKVFEEGAVVVEIEWIDQQFPPDEDGYASLAITLWTWLSVGPPPGTAYENLVRYLLAAARRLDLAHRQFQRIRRDLDELGNLPPGPQTRRAVFDIVGEIEMAVVALSRAVDMATKLPNLTTVPTPVPASMTAAVKTLTQLRNAYEHIEDRAQGQVLGKPDPVALTIFDWTSLLMDGAITYGPHRLELNAIQPLLLDTRSFLKTAAGEVKH